MLPRLPGIGPILVSGRFRSPDSYAVIGPEILGTLEGQCSLKKSELASARFVFWSL